MYEVQVNTYTCTAEDGMISYEALNIEQCSNGWELRKEGERDNVLNKCDSAIIWLLS